MNEKTDDLADAYDQAQAAGRLFLSDYWANLGEPVREWLVRTGHYTERGAHRGLSYGEGESQVDALEYTLGKFRLCARASLPSRTDKGASIPPEVASTEVRNEIAGIFLHPLGQDPEFLRLALYALRQYEMANLLASMPPLKESHGLLGGLGRIAFGIFCILLMLASPAILAEALTAAAQGNSSSAAVALYMLGFVAWMFYIAKGMSNRDETQTSLDERAYAAWHRLGTCGTGHWTATGAGAKSYFEDMLRQGLPIPLVALDIAEALRVKLLLKDDSAR